MIKITCDKASAICDKSQYDEASFFEKVQLNWHLLVCKICCKYTKHNRIMSEVFKIGADDCRERINYLSIVDKDNLKKELCDLEVESTV